MKETSKNQVTTDILWKEGGEKEMIQCHRCGFEFVDDGRRCPKCGDCHRCG
jgi:predicted Zn-ribbon and HTH transcriptional regulator|tara:strand:+ start:1951 stop:2103 length:153 start_codon:yes stop_codon:yes gene_type:complete